MTPTAGQLFDAFLAHRGRTVTARTVARDRAVLERFRGFLDVDGPCFLDEATGRPLPRERGGVGLCDIADVDVIIMGTRRFLGEGLPAAERRTAARTVKQFVLWMERLDELDCCSSLSLQALCDEHAPPPQRRRRAGPWPRR